MKPSVCLIWLGLFSMVCSVGCIKENQKINFSPIITDSTQQNTDTSNKTFSWISLGDSYTIGQGVQPNERFAAQTIDLLKNNSKKIGVPVYIATTGWTTTNLINAINQQNPPKNFDVVTLLIGVNDQYQRMDTAGYRTRFTQLLNTAVALASGNRKRVFILSIPDYSVTPFVSASDKARVSMEIDWFNSINKQITLQNQISYTDITSSTRQAATDPSLIATDRLHPSGKEYAKWAQLLAPQIIKELQ